MNDGFFDTDTVGLVTDENTGYLVHKKPAPSMPQKFAFGELGPTLEQLVKRRLVK